MTEQRFFSTAFLALVLATRSVSGQAPMNPPESKPDNSPLLAALGSTLGALLFEEHDKILLCEKFIGQVNEVESTRKRLTVSANLLNIVNQNMTKALDDPRLTPNDIKFLTAAIETSKMILKQAELLKAYMSSKNDKDRTAYLEARDLAHQDLNRLLGIKK